MLVRSATAAAVPILDTAAEQAAPKEAPSAFRGAGRLRAAPQVAPAEAVAARPPADPLSFAGLAACVKDAAAAANAGGDGPADPVAFAPLRARLAAARSRLPPEYRRAVADPLLHTLDRLGARGFARVLAEDPDREGQARLLLDVSQAVLQQGQGRQARATAALQEVVSDLYDGFLSAESRRGVKPPERGVTPPLVRWGSAEAGPNTWPAGATASLGVKAAVVSLPAGNASAGLLAWPALAHETAGHDLLGADVGLRDELAGAVQARLLAEHQSQAMAGYWSERIDETAADVLGVLNMGPAAAVGLVGYFRGLNEAWRGTPTLRNVGRVEDPHPADLARAYLAAETVRLLSFKGAGAWADRLIAEADKDLGHLRLGDEAVTPAVARASAAAVARAIVRTPLQALEGRSLGEIQDWGDQDEAIVAELRKSLDAGRGAVPAAYAPGAYAAHAVAAGVYEAVSGHSTPAQVMDRMVGMLDAMHARNPEWAPTRFAAPAVAGAGREGRTG